MLHMNGSTLAAATPDGIQSPQASSSNPVGSNLSQKKTCPYCGQQLSWHALSRHIRDMHKAKSNFVTCKFCNKMFRNKNSLGCHMWRFHKEAKEGAKDASIKAEPKIDNDIKPSSVEVENPWFLLDFSFSCIFSFLFSEQKLHLIFCTLFCFPSAIMRDSYVKLWHLETLFKKSFFFSSNIFFFDVQIAFFILVSVRRKREKIFSQSVKLVEVELF